VAILAAMEQKHRLPKYSVRLPLELRAQLAAAVAQADRSLHNEILHRLKASLKRADQREGARP
jgi:hypothetical protein